MQPSTLFLIGSVLAETYSYKPKTAASPLPTGSSLALMDYYNQLCVQDLRIVEMERVYLLQREAALYSQLKTI